MDKQNQNEQNNIDQNTNQETYQDTDQNLNNFQDPELKTLRTYQYDVKEAVEDKNITLSQMMLTEKAKQRDNFQKKAKVFTDKKPKIQITFQQFFIYALSVVMFIMAGIIIYITQDYVRSTVVANPNNPDSWAYSNIIESEKNEKVSTVGESDASIIRQIQDIILRNDLSGGEIIEIILSKKKTNNNDGKEREVLSRLSTYDFFNILGKDLDHPLVRSLDEEFVLGAYKGQDSSPFIIIQTKNINQTYSELIRWEDSMARDLKGIFFQSIPSSSNYNSNDFVDLIINNKDARAIRNNQNQVVLFYSIIDNKNIIITNNQDGFNVLLNRINLSNLIQ